MKNTTTVERLYIETLENSMNHIQLPASQVQVNHVSKRNYKKVNQLILVARQAELKSKSNEWLSKDQLEEANLKVKENQYGVQLFSFKLKDVENSDKKVKTYSYYTVYNLEQLEKAQ